jgi:hypothetical protein
VVEFSSEAEPMSLSPIALGTELALIEAAQDILSARKSGLAAQAESYIRRGERVAWYSLEPSRSRLNWVASREEVKALGALFNIPMEDEPKLITPTQAINKGIDEVVISQYAERSKPAMKLVQDSTQQLRKVLANG